MDPNAEDDFPRAKVVLFVITDLALKPRSASIVPMARRNQNCDLLLRAIGQAREGFRPLPCDTGDLKAVTELEVRARKEIVEEREGEIAWFRPDRSEALLPCDAVTMPAVPITLGDRNSRTLFRPMRGL